MRDHEGRPAREQPLQPRLDHPLGAGHHAIPPPGRQATREHLEHARHVRTARRQGGAQHRFGGTAVVDQQLRLLHRGEMPSPRHHCPLLKVRVPLRDGPRVDDGVRRKGRYGGGDLDLRHPVVHGRGPSPPRVGVDAGRRDHVVYGDPFVRGVRDRERARAEDDRRDRCLVDVEARVGDAGEARIWKHWEVVRPIGAHALPQCSQELRICPAADAGIGLGRDVGGKDAAEWRHDGPAAGVGVRARW